jgi:chromosome segregation ATPase
MASLEALTKSYRAKKAEVSKLRRKNQDNLKATLSQKRRSSSGLASIERKKESLSRQVSHVTQMLNLYHAQKESIARLKIAAEERLRHEQDTQDSIKQQIDYGAPEEKGAAQERLRFVNEKIIELHAEIKEREAAEGRLEKQIDYLEKEKGRLDSQLKKQNHAKPGLVEQLKSSEKTESVLRPRVESLIKKEASATKTLQIMVKKLGRVITQRKKTKAKRRTATKRTKGRKMVRKTKKKRIIKRKATKKRRSKSRRK